jgi:hypothetical protein
VQPESVLADSDLAHHVVLDTLQHMAENEGSLDQRLEEIGTQLAWVRDYL